MNRLSELNFLIKDYENQLSKGWIEGPGKDYYELLTEKDLLKKKKKHRKRRKSLRQNH